MLIEAETDVLILKTNFEDLKRFLVPFNSFYQFHHVITFEIIT